MILNIVRLFNKDNIIMIYKLIIVHQAMSYTNVYRPLASILVYIHKSIIKSSYYCFQYIQETTHRELHQIIKQSKPCPISQMAIPVPNSLLNFSLSCKDQNRITYCNKYIIYTGLQIVYISDVALVYQCKNNYPRTPIQRVVLIY